MIFLYNKEKRSIVCNNVFYLWTKWKIKGWQFHGCAISWTVCWFYVKLYHLCVRLVRARSRSGMAVLVSLCPCDVVMWGGDVSTLWATPGAFSSDHNSSPRVTMANRSSSSMHQVNSPPLVPVLSLERNRDTLKQIRTPKHYECLYTKRSKQNVKKNVTSVWGHVIVMPT